MNMIATFLMTLTLAQAAFAQSSRAPLACIRDAILAGERPRYAALAAKLRAAARQPQELSNGYAIPLDEGAMSVVEAAEWISLERKCCPFLKLAIEVEGTGRLTLRLTGPDGVKEFLNAELKITAK
jgi:hypothetical protein